MKRFLNFKSKQTAGFSLLTAASLLLLVLAAVMYVRGRHAAPPATSPSINATSAPSSQKPKQSEIDNYKVAADLPRFINIPAINIPKTRVMQLGATNGKIDVPTNVFDVGWYNQSAKPGQSGAVFAYGHISSWQSKGIFYDLHKLQPGDQITVERGDGHKYDYQVVQTIVYPADKVDMNQVLTPIKRGQQGLNLMTCTGKVKPGTSEFTERLVVFASLVKDY